MQLAGSLTAQFTHCVQLLQMTPLPEPRCLGLAKRSAPCGRGGPSPVSISYSQPSCRMVWLVSEKVRYTQSSLDTRYCRIPFEPHCLYMMYIPGNGSAQERCAAPAGHVACRPLAAREPAQAALHSFRFKPNPTHAAKLAWSMFELYIGGSS